MKGRCRGRKLLLRPPLRRQPLQTRLLVLLPRTTRSCNSWWCAATSSPLSASTRLKLHASASEKYRVCDARIRTTPEARGRISGFEITDEKRVRFDTSLRSFEDG